MKCFTFVNIETGKPIQEAIVEIKSSGIVKKVIWVNGGFDLIVELEGTQEEIRDTITWKIRKLKSVRSTMTIMEKEY